MNDKLSHILLTIEEEPLKMQGLIRTYLAEEVVHEKKNILELHCYQKLAHLVISVGEKYAPKLFELMAERELETVTFEISRIEYITANEKNAIIDEVYDLLNSNNFISIGGVDFVRNALEVAVGSQRANDTINRLSSSLQLKPFDFIRRTDPAHLLNFIQQEHPQTMAVVLSYLEPNKASVILQNLPCELQSEVLRRIACMDRVSPETLREVERVLEKKLSTIDFEMSYTAGGIESAVEVLNLVDRSTEKQIIDALEDEDPELAEEIKKRMFIFEDIVMLDDRSIQKVMREVDAQELAKALVTVDSEVQNKIFRNMSKRAEGMLKEDMEYLGPIKLSQVEEAQEKIVSIIRHLEDVGEIIIARGDETVQFVAQPGELVPRAELETRDCNDLELDDKRSLFQIMKDFWNAGKNKESGDE